MFNFEIKLIKLRFLKDITVWSITSNKMIHRPGTFLASEAFFVVDMTHRDHLLSSKNLQVKFYKS